jgi:DNA-binding CsgD family transcriptional regulator
LSAEELEAIEQSSYLQFVRGLASLAGRDFDRILSFVREAAAADGDEPFGLPTIDGLARLVPADQAGYYEYEVRTNHGRTGAYNNGMALEVKQPGPDVPWADDIQATWWHWPLNDVDNRHRVKARRFSTSLPTRAEKRRSAWRALVMRPSGIADELDVWLPAPAGTVRAFFFVRGTGRRNFSDRDEAVATLLRPQLEAIRQRWERRHRPSELTRREAELLDLVRAGLTNREIAGRLVISPATVRVHLSNLFGKLGVHTRTAAATVDFNVAE